MYPTPAATRPCAARRGLQAALACLALLPAACGGGTSGPSSGSTSDASAATPATAPRDEVVAAATRVSGDALVPTAQLAGADRLVRLNQAATSPAATLDGVGATAGCPRGYTPPATLTQAGPAALPPTGGTLYAEADLPRWRDRAANGPFKAANDFTAGSPGDAQRIRANANAFLVNGEATLTLADDGNVRATHGTLARDAAFLHLLLPDTRLLAAVRAYLLAQAANPVNALWRLCLVQPDRSTPDAWFGHASWLLRFTVTYDYVRRNLDPTDRTTLDNFIRRNAYFLAAQMNDGLAQLFPARLLGNYGTRAASAAPATAADTWFAKRFDTNGDCHVDASDSARTWPMRTYVRADGTPGPALTVLSQWFNNRRSIAAAAVGVAGVMLGDAPLIETAKRYAMEWLTFAVWPDGSEGEYARNGDYCIAQQGVIYAAFNVQSAMLLARVLSRQGDASLWRFQTSDGLLGTEDATGAAPKSIERVARTRVDLLRGRLDWHADEPWRGSVAPRPESALGAMSSHYMGGAAWTDNYHELGMLVAAADLPAVPIAGLVLRDAAVTALPFPGASGHAVATGWGSWAGVWTDAFNALPAQLLLH